MTYKCDNKTLSVRKHIFYKQDNFLNTVIHHYNQVGCRAQSGIFINSVLTENVKETQKTNRFFDLSGFDEKFSCTGILYAQHKLEDNIIIEQGFIGKFCAKRKFIYCLTILDDTLFRYCEKQTKLVSASQCNLNVQNSWIDRKCQKSRKQGVSELSGIGEKHSYKGCYPFNATWEKV